MFILLLTGNSGYAQRMDTDFTISATGGSVSNTYMMPLISEWDRSRISGFTSFSPAGQIRYRGENRSASLYGAGHFLHFYDDRPAWGGVFLSPVFRQHIASGFSVRGSGGWSYFTSNYSRNMQWLFAGMEWMASPFSKFEITVGSSWRTYLDYPDRTDETQRYDSYGVDFQYWPAYRWQLRASFYSSLAHLRRPSDGFAVSMSVAHFRRSGTSFILQTALEQYSFEFQRDPGNGLPSFPGSHQNMPVYSAMETMQNGEITRLEDRFHRTSLHVSHPFSEWLTVTGSLSGLLWFSSEDNDIVSDFQVSAGVQIPISIPVSRSGEIRSVRWATNERRRNMSERPVQNLTRTNQNNNGNATPDSEQKQRVMLTIQYRGDASLYITGNFTDWDDPGIPLQKIGRNRYRVEIDLSAGVYEYKIRKQTNDQDDWLELPDDVTTVNDGFGGRNGKLFIDY